MRKGGREIEEEEGKEVYVGGGKSHICLTRRENEEETLSSVFLSFSRPYLQCPSSLPAWLVGGQRAWETSKWRLEVPVCWGKSCFGGVGEMGCGSFVRCTGC